MCYFCTNKLEHGLRQLNLNSKWKTKYYIIFKFVPVYWNHFVLPGGKSCLNQKSCLDQAPRHQSKKI